jgi:hypothetical protein
MSDVSTKAKKQWYRRRNQANKAPEQSIAPLDSSGDNVMGQQPFSNNSTAMNNKNYSAPKSMLASNSNRDLSFKQTRYFSSKSQKDKVISAPSESESDSSRRSCLEEVLIVSPLPPDPSQWYFPQYFALSKSYFDLNEFSEKIVPSSGTSDCKYIFIKALYDSQILKRPDGPSGCSPKLLLFGTLEMMCAVAYPLSSVESMKGFTRILKQNGILKFLLDPIPTRTLTGSILDIEVKNFVDTGMLYDILGLDCGNNPRNNSNILQSVKENLPIKFLQNEDFWRGYPTSISDKRHYILEEIVQFCSQIVSFRALFRNAQPNVFNFPEEQLKKYNNYYK